MRANDQIHGISITTHLGIHLSSITSRCATNGALLPVVPLTFRFDPTIGQRHPSRFGSSALSELRTRTSTLVLGMISIFRRIRRRVNLLQLPSPPAAQVVPPWSGCHRSLTDAWQSAAHPSRHRMTCGTRWLSQREGRHRSLH